MLKGKEKIEIGRLEQEGLNITEIAKRLNRN